jgi:predicted permease
MRWLGRFWHRAALEAQLDKELRFHLDQHAADLIADGVDPAEARRLARLAIGGPDQVREDCRDARGTRWLEDLLRDTRYALRTLRQKPGFAVVALLTLALGIGAGTVMFTVVNGVLLKPLPFPQSGRLVAVHGYSDNWNVAAFGEQNLSYPDFLDCKLASRSLDMAGRLFNGGTLSEPGTPEYVDDLREVTSDYFSVLGVQFAKGRAFLPDEDRPGGEPVAILGHTFWQHHFAGNPAVIGTSLVLDTKRYTIVGIAPAGLQIDGEAELYIPLGQDMAPYLHNRRAHPIGAIARLKPGETIAQAQSEFSIVGRQLAASYPATNKQRTFVVGPLRPFVGDVRSTLWLLMGAVSLVLLIACANVAGLLLARAVSRERELAMRMALGAGRGRLARQCLTESAVLGLSGGVLGVVLAAIGIRPFVAFWPGVLPRSAEVGLDWRVLLFAVAVSLLSSLIFGLAPALRAPVRDLEATLRAGARTLAAGTRRLHGVFIMAEIVLAVVLLVSAGILGRTLLRQSALDPGLDTHNVLVTRVALSPAILQNPARIRAAWQDVLERGRAIAGVQAIAAVDTVPMREGNNQVGYWSGPVVPPANQQPLALATSVTPDYFKVMRIPLRQGRFFDDRDRPDTEPAVVIDDVLARNAFPGLDAVGRSLRVPDLNSAPMRVVGVVAHVRHWGLAGDDQAQVRAQLYYTFSQLPDQYLRRWSELMSIVVRTSVPPLGVLDVLRHELRGVTGDQVLYNVRTMEQLAAASLARQRFLLLLFSVFACLALLLACIGIYGVLAYLSSRRVPEFGVRMALGATARDVIGLVLRQSMIMIAAGVAGGVGAALAASRILRRLVDGMQPTGPTTYVIMAAVLVLAALIASFLPARRAARLDPVRALRQD